MHNTVTITAVSYGTAQFKIDTRVQQTRVHLTNFVEAHARVTRMLVVWHESIYAR